MSAQYASATDALERAESIVGPPSADTAALVGIGRALLAMGEELEALVAMGEELEALVELLRERLPVPERAESRGMRDPRAGSEPTAVDVVDDPPCAAFVGTERGDERCRIPLSEHGIVRDHEWIRP